MKKLLFVLICALLACTLLSACEISEDTLGGIVGEGKYSISATDYPSFEAKVLEIAGERAILVEPDESSNEAKSSDKISVGVASSNMFEVGDRVRIYHNGEILESYPAQLSKVYRIDKLGENGEVVSTINIMSAGTTTVTQGDGEVVYATATFN